MNYTHSNYLLTSVAESARSPFSRHWRTLMVVLAAALGALLCSQKVFAHEFKPSPQALLPACRVETTTCSWRDLSRRDWGAVQMFPPGASPGDVELALDALQVCEPLQRLSDISCTNGFAGIYPCENVDLLAFLPVTELGANEGNTLWGWVDPESAQEYVIVGLQNGVAFVEITDPTAPRFVAKLPTRTGTTIWRDMKVYQNHAYIASDLNGAHGMQIFDLTRLRELTTTTPITLAADALYDGFKASHNIVINEESGYLYAVGTETCSGGLHMVDIRTPTEPVGAGCYSADGYVHDAQCVIYRGPDPAYSGRELCFNAGAAHLVVVDVTDKAAPVRVSSTVWPGLGYVHQGWLTADQRYLLVDDELDERVYFHNSRTYVFDMLDLAHPALRGYYQSNSPAVDHNLYIKDGLIYQANYTSGLRVLAVRNLAYARLREVAYFDTYPGSDEAVFNGAWSPYPFFPSGVVAVNTIDRGLFLLRLNLPDELPSDEFTLFLPLLENEP